MAGGVEEALLGFSVFDGFLVGWVGPWPSGVIPGDGAVGLCGDADVVGKNRTVERRVVAGGGTFGAYFDAGEEGLVDLAPRGVPGRSVGGGEVGQIIQRLAKGGVDVAEPGFEVVELTSDSGEPVGDAFLFDLHQVEWDGPGVMGLEQFEPFVFQSLAVHPEPAFLGFPTTVDQFKFSA